MDHSGCPPPYDDGFVPDIGPLSSLDAIEIEERLVETLSSIYGVEKERFSLSSGAQNANFLLFHSYLGPKDLIAVENPTFMPIRSVAESICRVETFERSAANDFRPKRTEIDRLLKKGPKVIVVTNLHNPSAASLSDPDLKGILEVAGEKGAIVLCDEIYRRMQYSTPSSPVCMLGDNGVSTSGLTKLYGLGDLRVGWLVGPEEICRKVDLLRLYNVYRLPTRSAAIAIEALKRREWFRDRTLRLASINIKILREWLEEEDRVYCRLPDGGLMALISLPKGMDDLRLGEALMDRFSTSVCPGRYFGIANHIRVTFSCSAKDLRKGLENISAAIDTLV
ncbi:MAG: pyridoxal phosphate-dependent aminotransferase [Methanomassiliicoccales archaeon]|jgi:aspartate/methionine/tyrosine aminotransferase